MAKPVQLPRNAGIRAKRIATAKAKLEEKLAANPEHPHAEGYARRIEEYDADLEELTLLAHVERRRAERAGEEVTLTSDDIGELKVSKEGNISITVPTGRVGAAGQG